MTDTTLPVPMVPEDFRLWWNDNFASHTPQDPSWDEAKRCALGAWYAARACMAPLQERADALQAELNSIADTLPGVHYMDPPDGGAPALVEQFKRMAKDARRADALEAALKSALKHAKKNGMQGWPVFMAMERLLNPTGGES